MRFLRFVVLQTLLILAPVMAFADIVTVQPVSSTNLSGTITTTNTFQSIQSSNNGRHGCTVQNNSATNSMWVFFGPIASATTAKSVALTAGGMAVNCQTPSGVLTDQVSVTGTSGDAYLANFQ